MLRIQALVVACLFVSSACRSELIVPEQPAHVIDPISAFEGRWIHRGPINIIGAGLDKIWTIARDDSGWSLTVTYVRHPSVNEKSRALTRNEYAPTPLAWRDGCLDFVYPPQPGMRARLTADIVGERLMVPALVQRNERTWAYEAWNDHDSFQCEHDPQVVPSGSAVVSRVGYPNKPCFYRASEEKSITSRDRTAPSIVFFQLAPDGAEHICTRLVFEGEPYGTLMWLGDSYSGFAGDAWERLSDQEWYAIQALPLVQPL